MDKMSLLVREFKCKVLSSVVDPKHFNFGSRSYLSIWFGSNFRLDLDPVPNKKIYSILVQVLNFNKLKLTPTERFSTFQFCFIKFHNFLCMKLLHFNVNLPTNIVMIRGKKVGSGSTFRQILRILGSGSRSTSLVYFTAPVLLTRQYWMELKISYLTDITNFYSLVERMH